MALYEITDQIRRTDITRAGETVEQMEVFFETESGITDSVVVPMSEFTEEEVRRRVKERAATIEKLQGATG